MPFSFHYYELFRQNFMQGGRYCIKLKDGRTLKGVPTVGSMLDPDDPDAVFFITFDDSTQETLYWRDFVSAEKISLPTSQEEANSANTSAGVSAKTEKPGVSTKCANQSPSSS